MATIASESKLVIIESHPVQYHAPVWRYAYQNLGVPLHVVYGSDFSVRGYNDREFGTTFRWESDLCAGYPSSILQPNASDYYNVSEYGLDSLLGELQPSAILSLGYHHRLDKAGIVWAKKNKIPLMFRGETSDSPKRSRGIWKSFFRDIFLRRFYASCTACLYIGENSKNHYHRLGVRGDQLIRSPYCVDTQLFRTDELSRTLLRRETRERNGISADDYVVVYSGKLSHRKGIDLIPAAIRSLPEAVRNKIFLVFVGSGNRKDSLMVECNNDIRIRNYFAGFVNQSGLSAWYSAADVLLLPSLEMETWGLVVNDAMHHGLPAVVSDVVGCAADLVSTGRTGEIFDCGSSESLAEALLRCFGWSRGDSQYELSVRQNIRSKVADYSIANAAFGIKEAWEKL